MNGFYEDNNSHPIKIKNHLFFDNSISVNNSQFNTLTDPVDDAIERELSSYELLGQVAPKYEEMQPVLVDCVPEQSRKILLGNALSLAINSNNNSIEYMQKQLTDFRKAKSRMMMLNDLTGFYGTGEEFTKEFLKLMLIQRNIVI